MLFSGLFIFFRLSGSVPAAFGLFGCPAQGKAPQFYISQSVWFMFGYCLFGLM
jgi:hypothetical protein